MTYESVTKVKALDGSFHDTVEAARDHDERRQKQERAERRLKALSDLVIPSDFYSISKLVDKWQYEDDGGYSLNRFREEVARFIQDNWDAIAQARNTR